MLSAPFGFVRVAAAAPRVFVADPERNASDILRFVERARGQGTQFLVFPELTLTSYTAGDLFFSMSTLVQGAERALSRLLRETASLPMVIVVGLPVPQGGRLFNAAAVFQAGRLLGVVPKTFLPGYKEYYEERWFSSAREAIAREVRLCGQTVPFGTDLLFALDDEPGVALAVEICEDLWAAVPPTSQHAAAGATLLANLSASNELVAKAEYRRELIKVQSGRLVAGYIYAGAGVQESTTDLVFSGHLLVAENSIMIAENQRFQRDGSLLVTDIDVERLLVERMRQTTFADGVHGLDKPHRHVSLVPIPPPEPHRLVRAIDPHPFVPKDTHSLDDRCEEVFSIQTAGLAKRLEHTGIERVTLGLSGGLDSTLALLVAVRTFELLSLPRAGILAVTMPGFGTTTRTLENARRLASALGVSLREIDIRAACTQHIADIGLDAADTQSATYQNLQARERTQVLFDLANKEAALSIGTGDLSEIALGWCTFGADQISMYNVNGGVPKTLVRKLVSWVAEHRDAGGERDVLRSILETPISPELVPPGTSGASQGSEDVLGPYELHDFFLFCLMRLGAGPRKTLFLAQHAFAGRYDDGALRRTLKIFVNRFFDMQFKRSMYPDGPKVGSVSLSPRGDWRMPSDACKEAWLAELEP